MKKNYTLRKLILRYSFLFLAVSTYAQVGIGTTNPNGDALLELDASATPGGLLLPRVALTATNNVSPLSSHIPGMAVYNTATTSGANGVSPGYYFNDGSRWVRIAATSDASDDWKLTGNAGTVPGTNFIGTTDNQSFRVRTDNQERFEFTDNGRLRSFHNGGPGQPTYSWTSDDDIGMYRIGNNILGFSTNGNERIRILGNGQVAINGTPISSNQLTVSAGGSNAAIGGYTTSGDAFIARTNHNVNNGLWAVNFNPIGTTVLGGSNNISVYLGSGSGVSGSGSKHGVYAYAGEGRINNNNRGNAAGVFTLDTDSNPGTLNTRAYAKLAGFDDVTPDGTQGNADSYYGGYFSGGNENGTPSFAYAGMKYNTNNPGNSGTNFKIVGNGTNSTLINDANGVPRIMFSPEAPEILFQDFGVGKLNNGTAYIKIDPILKSSLHIDDKHPLRVFITLEGECNGVYVTDKTKDGFTVKELQNGNSNVSFSWQIVANRADDINARGEITSKHIGLRLPVGPGLLKIKEAKMKKEDKRFDNVKKIQNTINNNNQQELESEEEVAKTVKQLTGKDKVKRD